MKLCSTQGTKRTICSREIFTKKGRQQNFDSDLKEAWHYNHVTFTLITKHFMLYCRLIYMLSMLYDRLTIKVKVGIPESFKVGWYPHKITGSSHLKRSIRMTDGSKNAIVSWLLNFRIHVFEKRSKEEGEAPDQKSLSFAFSILVYSRKTLHESSKIFVGYSFQPTPNSCVLATAGSTMTIGLSINRCLQLKKKTL